MNGKNILEQMGSGLSAVFAGALRQLFGAGVDQPVFGTITWADLAATLGVALLVVLACGLVATFLHLKKKETGAVDTKRWRSRAFAAVGKPIYLLICICGIYLAATPLLFKLPGDEIVSAARNILDKGFDLGVFAALLWLFFRLTHVLETWLASMAAKTESKIDDLFVPLVGKSLRIIVPVLGIIFALPVLGLPPQYAGVLSKGSSILLIIAVTLILFQAVGIGEKVLLAKYDISVADNLQARKVYTQAHVIRKTLCFVIGIFAVASILMLFEEVRRLGTSILASAGVIGVILGFAAQKTIANLFAGLQVALAQPIRIDDVVVVEGEWGNVEDITLTYVVLHLWDERRLIVPLSYFIEKQFENWTRVSANLLGAVLVWVDYSLPLEETRRAVKDMIENHPLWDKRYWNLQVTEATEHTMQIRVLATAADSSKSWDLRCDLREKLIAYIQQTYPQSLPQVRQNAVGKPAVLPLKP